MERKLWKLSSNAMPEKKVKMASFCVPSPHSVKRGIKRRKLRWSLRGLKQVLVLHLSLGDGALSLYSR